MNRTSSMRSAITLIVGVLMLAAYSSALQSAATTGPKPSNSKTTSKTTQTTKANASRQASAKTQTVLIDQFLFQPSVITVQHGETVRWKNIGSVPHTATSTDGKTFDSTSIAAGRSWSFKPLKKGTFSYVCTLHPNMKGKLIVK
jgi:plastocyanin